MSKLEIAKKVIEENFSSARCGIFCTENTCGDDMEIVYEDEVLEIDICYYYGYFEVFGLTKREFAELEKFYDSLSEVE